ncbi:MAG: acetyl-CoA carboxylase biotin carboxylase subunit [Chloroflexaceae bacterium]|nr:acetyl-CoA carboxylase biotin carboxylase subunit [Chloroflexaceae bacterium]
MFNTVLVANRGEIALRVMRACRELGLRAVAVYSEADRDAPHVKYADAAYLLGGAAPAESYLNIERIIEVAQQAGAEAIHPGYGFLSENSDFARAVRAANLIFVGPTPETMDAVSGKVAARNAARAVDVPVVPGTLEPLKDVNEAYHIAESFRYPVAIKAVGGGGGRGLRVVRSPDEIKTAFESARREAELSFKNSELYMEKYLANPRHIEVQVLGDLHGNVVAIGERDCSIQRRHQKLIEECPSPVVTPEQRIELQAAAVRFAKSVGYIGAGTLEFLYENEYFYFLELNSRIQVEHPVTEMVYGIDLVKMQLRIAQGEPLPFTQEDLTPRGHAIECRINAEDPTAGFRPALGTITEYQEPAGFGVRVDSGVRPNYTIPQFYDSMLGKLIAWGNTRTEALARMRRALDDYVLEGVTTVIPFHKAVLNHPTFIAGDISVNFIPNYPELIEQLPTPPAPTLLAEDDEAPARTFTVEVNGRQFTVRVAAQDSEPMQNGVAPAGATARKPRRKTRSTKLGGNVDGVVSPLQGMLREVRAEVGQRVEEGDVLFIIEAMKMENEIKASRTGIINEIKFQPGVSVEAGSILATFKSS